MYLGLKKLYWLTSSGNWNLWIDLESFQGENKYTKYKKVICKLKIFMNQNETPFNNDNLKSILKISNKLQIMLLYQSDGYYFKVNTN